MSRDLDAVLQYLEQANTDYAYMISGPWGSGKTYFWKTVVVPAIQRNSSWRGIADKPRIVYVSLYGIRDTKAIQRSILTQLHPTAAKITGVLSFIAQGAIELYGMGNAAQKVDITEWALTLSKTDNVIICIDDVERASISVIRLFGCINQYVEHGRAKVVLLCNEQELMRKGGDRYRRSKEKVVRITRAFSGTLDEALDSIVAEFSHNAPYKTFLDENKGRISSLFAQSGGKNLRILKYGLLVLESAFDAFPQISTDDRKRLATLMNTVLPVTFDYQEGRISGVDAERLITEGRQALWGAYFLRENDKKSTPIDDFERRYNALEFPDGLLSSRAIADLVVTGHLDKAKLTLELEAEAARRDPKLLLAQAFIEGWYTLEDAEFVNAADAALEALATGVFSTWDELLKVVSAFGLCAKYKLLARRIAAVKAAFDTGVRAIVEGGKFERVEPWLAEDKLELVVKESPPIVRWARDRLVKVNADLDEAARTQNAIAALAKLDEDPDQFSRQLSDRQGRAIGDRPLMDIVPPPVFLAQVTKASNAARHRLRFAIRSRYSNSPDLRALLPDIRWLSKVEKGLSTLIRRTNQHRPSRLLLDGLKDDVVRARKELTAVRTATLKAETKAN
jgi:hypothetical protein